MSPEEAFVGQTVFLAVLFVSIAFRKRGNYLVHGILMIVPVAILWVVQFSNIPSFLDGSFFQSFLNPFSTLVVFGLHAFLGFAALISGTWLVALWRPRSTDFAAKSKKIWQLTVILWVSAYVVGVLLFPPLRAAFLREKTGFSSSSWQLLFQQG